jgi:hypothetical protein
MERGDGMAPGARAERWEYRTLALWQELRNQALAPGHASVTTLVEVWTVRDPSNGPLREPELELDRILVEEGALGWELVGLVPEGTLLGDPTTVKFRAVFKRRVQR